jgi:hypothetical protein
VKEVLGRGANAITYQAIDNTSGKAVSGKHTPWQQQWLQQLW